MPKKIQWPWIQTTWGEGNRRTSTLSQGPKRTENDKGRHRVTCHGLAWNMKVFSGEPLKKVDRTLDLYGPENLVCIQRMYVKQRRASRGGIYTVTSARI